MSLFQKLKYFGCQRNDLHIHGAELTCNGAEDTAASDFAGVVEQYACVIIETDIGTVGTADFLLSANDESLRYGTFFNIAGRDDVLDRNDDNITHRGVTATRTTEDTDAESFACAAVVCDSQS